VAPAKASRPFRVVAPPPAVFLLAYVVGLAINHVVPWSLGSAPALLWVGGALAVVGLWFAGGAAILFRRAGTDLDPGTHARTLVTDGPYRWSRNPIYVGMTLGYAGIAVATHDVWPLVLLAIVLPLVHYGVILREEQYLAERFGPEYVRYRERVRRWL
jgi:protein-S-isoprenylcysteine O-methyltransferase Ste14